MNTASSSRLASGHSRRNAVPGASSTGCYKIVPPESVLRLAAAIKKADGKVLLIHREKGGHETSLEDTVAALEFVFAAALDGNGAKDAKLAPAT